ncbi:MAG: hypothetical protein RIR00_1044 [Pseudomonadota bacterium]|jgi:NAD(P)-dependent dehydrogenase (short-subunit alcohol dehydrogenase family)
MDLQIHGKRALISGSTAGIGYAIAQRLAAEGAAVCLNGRDPARLTAAVARLQAEFPGVTVSGIAADLGTAAGCAALTAALPEVDLLINNLGIFAPKAFLDIPDADWQRMFEVNVMSGVRLSRHYLPAMQAAGFGRIVFISSESALQTPSEMVHYGTSKTAQLAVARGIAEGCIGGGVTVNSVLPGPTRSEGVVSFFAEWAATQGISVADAEQAFFRSGRPSSLLRRFIEPAEVASLVAYLCSPLAAATHGAALRVDGGVVRSVA